MHILFICSEYPPLPHGGIGTFVHTLAHGLREKGHRITVVGMDGKPGRSTDGGIEVFTLPKSAVPYVGNILSRRSLRSWLQRYVRREKVDIVETPDFLGMLPFGLANCPVVVRLHLSSTSIYLQRGQKASKGIALYEELTLRMNPAWAAVSNYIYSSTCEVFGIRPDRFKIIYNPVPRMDAPSPASDELPSRFMLFAGQVSKRKGAVVLAEAARELMSAHADLHLVYAGGAISTDDPVPITQRILDAVGPEFAGRVRFLGHVSHSRVLECMSAAAVYVFPSRLEAFGLVILEAMYCGTPVVCTSYPPGPEIVTDGVDGLLADPTSPSDLAKKISRILLEPALAERLRGNGKRTIVERFSLAKCIAETESFYADCLSGGARRPSFFAQALLSARNLVRK